MDLERVFRAYRLLVVTFGLAAAVLVCHAPFPYWCRVDGAREAALRTDLRTFRDVLDCYHTDRGEYPASLDELVRANYLRSIPVDPMTRRADTWTLQRTNVGGKLQVVNVHSGSAKRGRDGRPYSEW